MIALLLAIISMLVAESDQRIEPIAPCAMSMSEAKVEDELCSTWVIDGKVIFGPLWAR